MPAVCSAGPGETPAVLNDRGEGMVFAADFSSDGSLIATAGGAIEDDTRGSVNIWDLRTGMLR